MKAALLAGTTCAVDDVAVPLTRFYMPPTNYGQPVPHLTKARYEIKVPLVAFLDVLGPHFEKFAREMKADEATDPTHDGFPELVAYQRLAYPDLRTMLSQAPSLLEDLLREWMEMPILEELSTNGPPPGFAFNSLDSVSISKSAVLLRGNVFKVA